MKTLISFKYKRALGPIKYNVGVAFTAMHYLAPTDSKALG